MAQSASEPSQLPPLEVETTAKKVKKRPGSEPQVPVTQASGSSAAPEEPVSNSANLTPTDAAKVGSSVTILTEKDLNQQSKSFLKDYLTQVVGVNFSQNGPPGSATRISIRGLGLKYVKVLIDGIDITDPSGIETVPQIEHLLVGDVSRIEVLKGSQSTLYGGDAIAGVISIETKTATKPGFFHAGNAEYGTYNTFRGAYTAGYAAKDGSNIALTVQGIDTSGFSSASIGTEDDGYRNLTVSGRGEYYLSPSFKVFFAARTLDAKLEYDGDADPDPFNYSLGDAFNSGTVRQSAGRVGTQFSLLNGAFQNTLAVQTMKIERDMDEPLNTPRKSFFDGERLKGEYKGVLSFNDRLALLAGADWETTALESANISFRPTADVSGVYAQLMVEPIDGLLLTGGGRIDEHSNFGQFNTYRLTAAYLLPGTETKLRGSLSTGFRAPSLDELYGAYPFGLFPNPYYGNPNLKPEESKSWDVGIEQGFQRGKYTVSATYFEIDTDNQIVYDFTGCSPVQPCMQNVSGITSREGVELTAAARIVQGLGVSAGYTYVETQTSNGERLSFVPRHTFVVGLDVRPIDKVELNVVGQYVADTFEKYQPPLDDYFLVSVKAAYEFTPGWKAYVRGENLLDEKYETITGYGTAGLTVFGGIQMAMPAN